LNIKTFFLSPETFLWYKAVMLDFFAIDIISCHLDSSGSKRNMFGWDCGDRIWNMR